MDIDPEKRLFLQIGMEKLYWHLQESIRTKASGHWSYSQMRWKWSLLATGMFNLLSAKRKVFFNPKNTFLNVKFGGRSITLWRGFSASEQCNLVKGNSNMIKELYIKILEKNIKHSAKSHHLSCHWRCRQDNDISMTMPNILLRHSRNVWDYNLDVLEWPSQFPDRNPIENL